MLESPHIHCAAGARKAVGGRQEAAAGLGQRVSQRPLPQAVGCLDNPHSRLETIEFCPCGCVPRPMTISGEPLAPVASLNRGTPSIPRREAGVLLLILAINLVLVSPTLMPAFNTINPHDEAKYIESGRMLAQLEVRDSWGPLVALVYAPFHLIVGESQDWFLLEAWAGRFVLYLLMWVGILFLAAQLQEETHVFVVAGVLFVSLAFFAILENQSDALFVSLSALALGKVLAFLKTRRLREVAASSALIGLACLSRVESLVLLGVLLGISLTIVHRRRLFLRIAFAALLPAAAILTLYSFAHRLTSGHWSVGIASRAYATFEETQSVLTGGDIQAAIAESRSLFGTREENDSSVLRAVLRNPPAFGLRLLSNMRGIPDSFLAFFGKRLGPVLLLFAGWALYALLRSPAKLLLGILVAWSLPAFVALGFLSRHFIPQVTFLVILLAAIGASFIFRAHVPRGERIAQYLSALLIGMYALADGKPAFLLAGLLIPVVLALQDLLRPRLLGLGGELAVPLLLMFGVGLVLRGPFPFPNLHGLGGSPEELAVHFLEAQLPRESRVLVPFPLPAVAARMIDINLSEAPANLRSSDELWSWLKETGILAIYWDPRYAIRPEVLQVIESGIGRFFEVGFTAGEGGPWVLLVRSTPATPD